MIPSNDFSLDDPVLDEAVMFGAILAGYGWAGGPVDLQTYFTLARGASGRQVPAAVTGVQTFRRWKSTTEGIRHTLEASNCTLFYLPPYSPDFNPIENAFSKLKALLRQRQNSLSMPCGTPSAPSSDLSNSRSAQSTSQQQDMTPIKMDALYVS